MNQHDLRAILLKLENRLSDDDRKRFHFFLGHDVPRRIRDDPSLGGTLNLIESLFDQDKINEQDFTFLIHAFEQIKCMDAVKLLREHMRTIGSQESAETLTSLMPCMNEEMDKYAFRTALLDERYMSSNSIERNDVNIDLVISKVDEPCAQDKRSGLFLFVFLLFIILTLTTLTTVIFMNLTDLKQEFQMKEKRIVEEQRKNDRLSKQIQHLQLITNGTTRELEKAVNQGTRQNITIEQLNNQLDQQREEQLKNQRMNEELHEELLRSFDEQQKQNETIEKLTHQCRSRSVTKANSIATAITTTTEYRPSTTRGSSCGCPITSMCRENCLLRFSAIDGRCTGFLDLACECLIRGVWQSKVSRC